MRFASSCTAKETVSRVKVQKGRMCASYTSDREVACRISKEWLMLLYKHLLQLESHLWWLNLGCQLACTWNQLNPEAAGYLCEIFSSLDYWKQEDIIWTWGWHLLLAVQMRGHGRRDFCFYWLALILTGKFLYLAATAFSFTTIRNNFFRIPKQTEDYHLSMNPPGLQDQIDTAEMWSPVWDNCWIYYTVYKCVCVCI